MKRTTMRNKLLGERPEANRRLITFREVTVFH